MSEQIAARRQLLRFLLASPLLAAPGLLLPRTARSRPELATPETLDDGARYIPDATRGAEGP